MKEKLTKLIDIKSMVTLFLTFVFCYLSIVGRVSPELFMSVFTVVIAFYFGTQAVKKGTDNNESKSE